MHPNLWDASVGSSPDLPTPVRQAIAAIGKPRLLRPLRFSDHRLTISPRRFANATKHGFRSDMTVHAQKRRTPSGAKAAKDVGRGGADCMVAGRSPNLLSAGVQTDGQFVELFDQVWALVLSLAEQSRELGQLKGGHGAADPQIIEAFLQAKRQALWKYDFLELAGEAWELKRIMMIRSNTIASLKGDPANSDINKDRIESSMGSGDRVEAFFDARRLTPSKEASDEIPAYVVHLLAERLWRRRNGNIPASVAASIAWLVLPGYERRQWLGRAAIATMGAARADSASILENAAKVAD